ncbi:Ribokinase-like protein [Haematococcus lacustris]
MIGSQHRGVGRPLTSRERLRCQCARPLALRRSERAARLCVLAEASPASQTEASGQRKQRVVAIGEALFDLIADQKGVPREKVSSWTPYAGGAPANVATALAKLGLEVLFLGALGRDAPGDNLYQLIKSSGVRLDGLQRRDEPTRDVYVVRDDKGDREFAGFGRPTEQYCDAFLDAAALPLEEIRGSAVLVAGTLGLAYPGSRAAMRAAVKAAKEGGCKVLVDVNWRPVFWGDPQEALKEVMDFMQQADLIKVSDSDLDWLLSMEVPTALVNPCGVAERFPSAAGVLVTAGGEGAAYCFKGPGGAVHTGFVPVFQVEVMDTTGAGDAFTSGFVYKLLEAGSIEALAADPVKLKEAVVFAAASGALTCTRKGAITGQPKLQEVQQLYESSKAWPNFW